MEKEIELAPFATVNQSYAMAGKIEYKNGGRWAPWSKTQDGACTETKITFISESAIVISFVVNGCGGALYAVTYN